MRAKTILYAYSNNTSCGTSAHSHSLHTYTDLDAHIKQTHVHIQRSAHTMRTQHKRTLNTHICKHIHRHVDTQCGIYTLTKYIDIYIHTDRRTLGDILFASLLGLMCDNCLPKQACMCAHTYTHSHTHTHTYTQTHLHTKQKIFYDYIALFLVA